MARYFIHDAVQKMLRRKVMSAAGPLATIVFLQPQAGPPLFLEGEGKAWVKKRDRPKRWLPAWAAGLIRCNVMRGWMPLRAVYAVRTCRTNESPFAPLKPRWGQTAKPSNRTVQRGFSWIERPLLASLAPRPDPNGAPVLLIDELTAPRAPFRTFLLEAPQRFSGHHPLKWAL